QWTLPRDVIATRDGTTVHLSRAFTDLADPAAATAEERTIPLVAEEVVIEKERSTTSVRLRTRVEEREEPVDEMVVRETVDVRRVPIDRYVDAPEGVREEGETTVVPLYEEVLVVEKRLVLREEIHLTKRREEHRERSTVHLRSEQADIERHPTDEA
nr:YsnF/AvaK domain-containing protein [Trueperaceae bacterium]